MIKELFKNKYELIIKNNYMHIKYYSKLLDISNSKVEVIIDKTSLLIKGSSLIVCALSEYEIVIKGNIKSIEFINE